MSQINRGQCLHCGDANPYTSVACSSCNARLPWADAISQNRQTTAKLAPCSSSMEPHKPVQSSHVQLPPVQLPPAQQNYCIYCGSAHIAGASYCSNCGKAVVAPPAQSLLGPLPTVIQNRLGSARNAPPQAAPPAQQPSVNVSVVTTQQNSDSHGWWSWWVGLFLFFFKLSVIVAFIAGVLAVIAAM